MKLRGYIRPCVFTWANLVMKSAYRSVMFYLGQKELEMQFKMNKIVAQCRQKCETMQEKFTEKLEQVHTAYQKMAKKCQMMQQEIESITKDNQELQEKFAEKSRSVSITYIHFYKISRYWCLKYISISGRRENWMKCMTSWGMSMTRWSDLPYSLQTTFIPEMSMICSRTHLI